MKKWTFLSALLLCGGIAQAETVAGDRSVTFRVSAAEWADAGGVEGLRQRVRQFARSNCYAVSDLDPAFQQRCRRDLEVQIMQHMSAPSR